MNRDSDTYNIVNLDDPADETCDCDLTMNLPLRSVNAAAMIQFAKNLEESIAHLVGKPVVADMIIHYDNIEKFEHCEPSYKFVFYRDL